MSFVEVELAEDEEDDFDYEDAEDSPDRYSASPSARNGDLVQETSTATGDLDCLKISEQELKEQEDRHKDRKRKKRVGCKNCKSSCGKFNP